MSKSSSDDLDNLSTKNTVVTKKSLPSNTASSQPNAPNVPAPNNLHQKIISKIPLAEEYKHRIQENIEIDK